MPRTRSLLWIALGLLLVAALSLAQTASQPPASQPPRKSRKKQPKPLVLPPLPPGPLPQLPMDVMPAAPPKVSYQSGMLTIVAQNSTLGDILRQVRTLTGASIDVPPNANERVFIRLGPGAPRDVLAVLLDGSSFNYVMLGSSSDPTALASVVLTAKPAEGAQAGQKTTAAASQPSQAFVPPQPPLRPVVPQAVNVQQPAGDDNADAEDQDSDTTDDNADQDQQQSDTNGAVQQPAPNAGPKTPEQILEMMRRNQQVPPGQQPGMTPNQQQPPEN